KVDEILSHFPPFALVRWKDRPWTHISRTESNLPAQIVRILHANVHTLSSLRTVSVDGVAGEKDAVELVEFGSNPLANLVRCPPVAIRILNLVWLQNLLRRTNNDVRVDLAPISATRSAVWHHLG